MHLTHLEAIAVVQKLAFSLGRQHEGRADVSVHPPFTALRSVQTLIDADGLPLALGTGTGSELRQPLGITICGGLVLSQALTLFTTPVVYLYMDRMRWWFLRRHRVSGQISPAGSHAD